MRNDFCVFILTHGRPDKLYTLDTLKRCNYSGDYYIVIDNEDEKADEYYERYGDKVLMFDKKKVAERIDKGDLSDNRKTIVFARNVCFDLAEEVGVDYFMELDDDYTSLAYKFNYKGEYESREVRNLDELLEGMIKYYEKAGLKVFALEQGGDYIGGKESGMGRKIKIKRKAMNTLLCKTEKKVDFIGRINEDVNTYVRFGGLGDLFFTTSVACIAQKQTQSNEGGMTDVYLDKGTYVKSFYTIMYNPSSVKISKMGRTNMRLHHKISWRHTVPK